MSNSPDLLEPREVRCNVCKGQGWVWLYDEETDCIDCEGFGSVIIG